MYPKSLVSVLVFVVLLEVCSGFLFHPHHHHGCGCGFKPIHKVCEGAPICLPIRVPSTIPIGKICTCSQVHLKPIPCDHDYPKCHHHHHHIHKPCLPKCDIAPKFCVHESHHGYHRGCSLLNLKSSFNPCKTHHHHDCYKPCC